MKNKITLLVLAAIFLSSCAKDLVYNYTPDTQNKGEIKIIPPKPIRNAVIWADDKAISLGAKVKSVTIKNIDEDTVQLLMGSTYFFHTNKTWNEAHLVAVNGQKVDKIIIGPNVGFGHYIYWTGLYAAYWSLVNRVIIASTSE